MIPVKIEPIAVFGLGKIGLPFALQFAGRGKVAGMNTPNDIEIIQL
jgi:UDP-N-acetyl-D-mannosaminuronate dehydrogenase